MLRLRQKIISFSVVSNKIAHNSYEIKKDRLISFYPIVGQTDIKLGTMSLNQPNNQNFLTTEMIDQLFRFMTSYQHDHSVENIWLQNQGPMFCAGVSFHQLTNNPDYLDKLYKMVALLAKMNKPIFAYVRGGVRNVGAYILSNAAVIMTDKSATMRIDQVSKGFVPIAGGVHRLTRIPAKLGLYLALTGTKISSDQMSRLGFINAIKKQGVSSKAIRSQMSRSNLFFSSKLKVAYQDDRDSQVIQEDKIARKKHQLNDEIAVHQDVIFSNNKHIFEKFAMNQYKIAQINYQNAKTPFNSFSEKPGRTINNYFMLRHQKAFKYLQTKEYVQASNYKDVRLAGVPIDKVLHIFGQDTLAESIKILQADQSDWAKETLRKIRTMDPLAAVLTFEMLQRGQHLSWDQCLEMQYTVAKRLLAQSNINLKQTYSGSKYIFVNHYSAKKVQDINNSDVISEFFNPIKTFEEKLELDVPTFALLPTVDYQQIPDSARLALNQIFFNDIHLPNQQRQARRYFESQKMDYRHKSFEVDAVRQQIYRKNQVEKIINRQSKRIELLVNNTSTMNKIVQGKMKYIDSIEDKVMEKYLENLIKQVFNQGIKDRFDEFSTTAETIGKQNKLKIFKNFRKTLINKIVVNGVNLENKQFSQNQSFRGPVYFDQHGRSIHESRNPFIKDNQQLKKLSDQLENRTISQQFKENQGTQPIDKHFGIAKVKIPYEENMIRIKHNIAKRYEQQPFSWDRAEQLEEMIKGAAQTSEQLAQYIQWDTTAYYNLILSAPATARTYNQMGERYVKLMQSQRQMGKGLMKQALVEQNRLIESYFSGLYPTKTQAHYKPNKTIINELLPAGIISKELEKCFMPLMDHVVKCFEKKYYEEGLHQKKVELGEFDNYLYQNMDREFVKVYKHDIIFVYSYLAILKTKDILHNLKVKGGVDKVQDIQDFFRYYAIEFAADQDIDSINKVLSNFLFTMLDLHTYTKGKVVLPQSKLLDFMNRTKILRESNRKSIHPLSFESIMLMVGKDRTKLYNKIIREYLPVEPQYLLGISKQAGENLSDKFNKNDTMRQFALFENAVPSAALERKTMISGYTYYLALFDSIVQKVSGKYNFANDQMLSNDPEKTRTQLGNLLNMKQTNQQWMDRVSRVIIKNIMNARLQIEKNLTKGQLLAFDQEWRELFMPEQFKLYLKYYLQSEVQDTKNLFRQTRNYSYETDQSQLHEQTYCNIRRSVKNPGAFRMLNNLKLAMDVHHDYILNPNNNIATQEQREDLVEDRREFTKYQRFPKQTYRRITSEVFSYGEEKNFDMDLNNLDEKQMDSQKHLHRMHFTESQDNNSKKMKFTQFEDEIRTLKHTLAKKQSPQIDDLYKKIEQLM